MKKIQHFASDPPLRAVRTFEAFARLGSVAEAARELCVTPSAVSHQLQLLETFVTTALTVRDGRALSLTDEGRDYYRSISTAFAVLRSATGFVRERSTRRQITVSLIPLFGMGWFIPRLHDFLEGNDDVDVTVLYANHRYYHSDAADLSIRFGTGDWTGYRSTRLLSGAVVPVCTPRFLRRHGPFKRPADLASVPLVHDEDRSTWAHWLQSAGVKHVARTEGPLFEDGQLTLNAALADLGAALLRAPLIERELASGQLVRLSEHELDDGRHYYLCVRAGAELPDGAQRLAQWIVDMLTKKHGGRAAA
ncbi:LysR substrate-binding domain-containing protein [Paraburkholderia kirstenboschensis]|uniref:LysR substrate-binding domain-containing protein n=1 Tax=Paraburkholderia kirstenboschensis TaxID=1245436 RepID=A0ABZ0EW48_9BURK|nr:LysR substrate-binding domain-containing protein [Paraburkholderia kirstenboschensis]WOD20423.1 LysR substrate-binding domain-containing protein [Paraburkholderia kirstenboschensis]